ncbi:MAG TPA: zinc dependent phospholipase C family protein [Bryobacteraceae bacterium]|nr:zinc dependent phospholipase C family protein [Bryobacteraceae bacterium]
MRVLALTLLLAGTQFLRGYAVLTHEAVIDSAWDNIKTVLLQRFPSATPDDLKKAHAYAYGGCIIQDMGYYPFASHFFSDLVHYVRSGDFVMSLLQEAHDLDETAFALGALAHYSADTEGHPVAVNRAVAIGYPGLRAKYGNDITYAQNPAAHLKTEFGFDVVEVAQGNYANEDYHDFIGFQVSKDLLERAFHDTYSLELKKQFTSLDLALGSYRRTVSTILPEATKVAWVLKKDQIVKARPGMTKQKFLYNMQRSSYEKEWGNQYERPHVFARFLAFLLRIVPKIGPFKYVAFKAPTAQTEAFFMKSFNETVGFYRKHLEEVRAGQLRLVNLDFDTGQPTRAGEYSLADETYGKLLRDLAKQGFQGISTELQADLLAFYSDPQPLQSEMQAAKKQDQKAWSETFAALDQLKAQNTRQ